MEKYDNQEMHSRNDVFENQRGVGNGQETTWEDRGGYGSGDPPVQGLPDSGEELPVQGGGRYHANIDTD